MDIRSKGEAVWELIYMLHTAGFINNPGEVLETILQRERQGGTTLGEGVAILHGRLPDIEEPVVALGILPKDQKVLFGEGQGESVEIIYMVLSPERDPGLHLQVLAAIAKLLSDTDVRTRLRYAKDNMEALSIIREHSDGGNT